MTLSKTAVEQRNSRQHYYDRVQQAESLTPLTKVRWMNGNHDGCAALVHIIPQKETSINLLMWKEDSHSRKKRSKSGEWCQKGTVRERAARKKTGVQRGDAFWGNRGELRSVLPGISTSPSSREINVHTILYHWKCLRNGCWWKQKPFWGKFTWL